MTIDGIDLLVFLVGVVVILSLVELWRWCVWNERRKYERLVHRNLQRAGLVW